MPTVTTYLGRLFGCFFLVFALSMVVQKQTSVDLVTGLVRDPEVVFVMALLIVLSGLAVIVGHNVWSGGALPVVVTLVGWLALLKGLAFLLLPPTVLAALFAALHYEQFFYAYLLYVVLFGGYLTYAGFRSPAQ
ncbi:MAG TPA: hypothetical protein VGP41_03625 [Candidatus Lustribacter sp.]|jgi:hypothetical protein|nr:hypothetical protein [Candidatus Lustribacter sp.]